MAKNKTVKIRLDSVGGYTDGAKLTPKMQARINRNERIRFDFNTQIKINGSTTMGVVTYLAKQYKVSEATVFRCIK